MSGQTSLFEPSRGAHFSPCRTWRYTLWRRWSDSPVCNFLMLNPSTADEDTNDPTVTRAERFARAWGYGGLIVTNLFAYRATDPREMKRADDPIGPENYVSILDTAIHSGIVVCAWGNHGAFMNRGEEVRRELSTLIDLHVLNITKAGQPVHPLYQPNTRRPIKWLEE